MAKTSVLTGILKERNNHLTGRTGSKVPVKSGPAVGNTSGNPTKRGSITGRKSAV